MIKIVNRRLAKKNLRKIELGVADVLSKYFSHKPDLVISNELLILNFTILLVNKLNLSHLWPSQERWSDGIGWSSLSAPVFGSINLCGEFWWGNKADYSAGLVPEPLLIRIRLLSRQKKKTIMYDIRLGCGKDEYTLRSDKEKEKNAYGETTIIQAVNARDEEVLQNCLSCKADIDDKSSYGITALMLAAMYGSEKMVQMLISKGASIDTQTEHGLTALMFAAKFGHLDTVRALLAAGCNYKIENQYGETASKLANDRSYIEFRPYKEIVEVLNQEGG